LIRNDLALALAFAMTMASSNTSLDRTRRSVYRPHTRVGGWSVVTGEGLDHLQQAHTHQACSRYLADWPELNDTTLHYFLLAKMNEFTKLYDLAHINYIFTARCTVVQSAVLPSHVVCLSVRLSVTLVDCDHIVWNSSKLISPLVSLGCSLFATPT